MSFMILVGGIPATGKTTLAKHISEQTHIPMASKDAVKEILFDEVGFHGRQEKVILGIAAMQIVYQFAEDHLRIGQSVILENNFENVSRPELEVIIHKYKCRPITIILGGDFEILHRRMIERDQSHERHRGHVVNDEYPEPDGERPPYVPVSLEQYRAAIENRGMLDFSVGGEIIHVDTTDFSKVSYADIVEKIRRIMLDG